MQQMKRNFIQTEWADQRKRRDIYYGDKEETSMIAWNKVDTCSIRVCIKCKCFSPTTFHKIK